MRQSELFGKTLRETPSGEVAKNAIFLERGGFVHKTLAGVYSFLPLGWRVLSKIENIVREELNKTGAQEIFLPALHPKENWEKTGRWNTFDALFKISSPHGQKYALGPTHEEIVYPLVGHYLESYKDMPVRIYQIQTKFRDEERAKSGLLRGREFRMKDLYSFHADDKDRDAYYKIVADAYHKIFSRIGVRAIDVEAGGGTFSDLSMEFQIPCEAGEDSIYVCEKCDFGINKELIGENKKDHEIKCSRCGGDTTLKKSSEIGNIFPLKDKFAKDFNLVFKDKDGAEKPVSAGCYGLGTSRLMGTIVEAFSDEKGIVWPREISPADVHLIELSNNDLKVKTDAEKIYSDLKSAGLDVLYDDRSEKRAGEKFADADLMGIPYRMVVSAKTLKENFVELKMRSSQEVELISAREAIN
ncbi:MAG: hypothetical protein COU46_01560, partial [Candidatus Niyogibacteria bacterium CG10_big_fil_rev_8_21_14_0_10_42_19]